MSAIGAAMAEVARCGWWTVNEIGDVLAAGHAANNANLEIVCIKIFIDHQQELV